MWQILRIIQRIEYASTEQLKQPLPTTSAPQSTRWAFTQGQDLFDTSRSAMLPSVYFYIALAPLLIHAQ